MKNIKQVENQMEQLLYGLERLLKGNEKTLLTEICEDYDTLLSKFDEWKKTEAKCFSSIPKRPSIEEEITNNLWEAIDFDKILVLHEKLYVTSFREEDDGDFPTMKDWKTFADKVDSLGGYYLSEHLSDGVTVFDENKKIRMMFKNPLRVITGFEMKDGVKQHIISKVTGIVIELDYEWYFSEGKQLATMLEVTGQIIGVK